MPDTTTDFLIIGGGIAGVSAAARLSHLGHVTLWEAEPHLATQSSARSAAMFEETYGKPSTVALNRASKPYHATENGGVLSPRGLMLVGSDDTNDAFERDLITLEMAEIAPAEARAMVPILHPAYVTRAAWHAAAWDLDTDRLIQNFAREARRNGTISTGMPLDFLVRTSRGWDAQSGQTTLGARVIVNAAGAWADDIALLADIPPLGLTPMRRSMARLAAPGGHDVRHWPMLFGPGETWYAKPDAGGLIVSPAEEDPTHPHDAFADDMVLAEGLARYQDYVTEPVTRPLATWAGLRTFTPDRQLAIGPDPSDPAFLWCAGQGGYGFQTAPAASQLLADLAAGRPPVLEPAIVAALAPARFRR